MIFLMVLLLSVPIKDIHVNDANGYPASPYTIGTTVTITGVITANFSKTTVAQPYSKYFVQDSTGGICVYYSGTNLGWSVGDSVTITDTIGFYNGLTEICYGGGTWTNLGTGTPPETLVLCIRDLNFLFQPDYAETLESRLVRINGVHFNDYPPAGTDYWEAGESYLIGDTTGQIYIYIHAYSEGGTHPLDGDPIPDGAFDVIGIVGQYDATEPYTWCYAIYPRFDSDIIPRTGPVILRGPLLTCVDTASIVISWEAAETCTGYVEYGTTASYGNIVGVTSQDTMHTITITGLSPATTYHYRVVTMNANDTLYSPDYTFVTAPDPSSGFTFVSMADSRPPVDAPLDSLPEAYVRILEQIRTSSYRPGFILFSGDMIVGGADEDSLLCAWRNWIDVTQSLWHTIPWFLAIGNHEENSYNQFNGEIMYKDLFVLPTNGPPPTATRDYSELVYHFKYGFAHFLVLDTELYDSTNIVDEPQRSWMGSVLAGTDRNYKFAAGHAPGYKSPNNTRGSCLEDHPEIRDSVWDTLSFYGVTAYFCGHFHHFDKSYYDRTDIPSNYLAVRQIINGTCGAPLYSDDLADGVYYHYVFCSLSTDLGLGRVYDEYETERDTIIFWGNPASVYTIALDWERIKSGIRLFWQGGPEHSTEWLVEKTSLWNKNADTIRVPGSERSFEDTEIDKNLAYKYRVGAVIPGDIIWSREILIPGVQYIALRIHCYPSISTGKIHLAYSVPQGQEIDISVVDLTGRQVKKIKYGREKPGIHHIDTDLHELPSGVYFIFLRGKGKTSATMVTLIK